MTEQMRYSPDVRERAVKILCDQYVTTCRLFQ